MQLEKKSRILIAEDDLTQSFVLKRLLSENGFEVTLANNGTQALAALQKNSFDIIVSDVEMPEMDGYTLCSQVKANQEWRKVPLVLLTNLSESENILRGLQAGADYYLTKPYPPKFLVERLRGFVEDSLIETAEQAVPPMQIHFRGEEHTVTAGRRQMLNLLLSTYENAVQQNRELIQTQLELEERNQQLREQSTRLKISESNFRSVLEKNFDGMVVVGRNGSVRYMNDAAGALLGGSLLDKRFPLQFEPELTREVSIELPMNPPRVAEVRAFATNWENEGAWLVVLRDISPRKKAEEQIREQQKRLEEANQKLQALATEDALTGLKNLRAFQERLLEEFERAQAYHLPLSLLLLDVDHFKLFNDSFGHQAGDQVLREVARCVREGCRNTDFAARYGGEEFVILMPSTTEVEAANVAERIRTRVEQQPWLERAITASFGVAAVNRKLNSTELLVRAADQALYCSKDSGRNRVSIASEIGLG